MEVSLGSQKGKPKLATDPRRLHVRHLGRADGCYSIHGHKVCAEEGADSRADNVVPLLRARDCARPLGGARLPKAFLCSG